MNRLLTYSEVADLTGQSVWSVKQATYRGELGEPVKFGPRRIRFTEAQVEKWIQNNRGRGWKK